MRSLVGLAGMGEAVTRPGILSALAGMYRLALLLAVFLALLPNSRVDATSSGVSVDGFEPCYDALNVRTACAAQRCVSGCV